MVVQVVYTWHNVLKLKLMMMVLITGLLTTNIATHRILLPSAADTYDQPTRIS